MDLERLLRSLDAPRALPSELRRRVERSLAEPSTHVEPREVDQPTGLLDGADLPRRLPPELRGRLEAALVAASQPHARTVRLPWRAAVIAVAAAVVASILVVSGGGGRSSVDPSSRAQPERSNGAVAPAEDAARDAAVKPPSASRTAAVADLPPKQAAPPFTSEVRQSATVHVAADPIVVGTVTGDEAQEAGFRAYVRLLNDSGGIHGRHMRLTEAPDARGTVATVNLSGETVAPREELSTGPLLETLTATEGILTGDVFSLASPVERQAHLLADAVFPQPQPGAVAVVYRGAEEPFAQAIPRALREVLEAREVTVVEAAYGAGRPAPFVPADAVFLSLPQEEARRFIRYARRVGYRPPRAMACLFPMLDGAIAGELEDGYLVLSPYSLGTPDERRTLETLSGRPASSATIHGWVTAKSLAVALWRAKSDSPADVRRALDSLTGYDTRFAPRLGFRPDSNARTPEGILYEVRGGSFVPRGGFRTDPF